jgi:hypothetical protein
MARETFGKRSGLVENSVFGKNVNHFPRFGVKSYDFERFFPGLRAVDSDFVVFSPRPGVAVVPPGIDTLKLYSDAMDVGPNARKLHGKHIRGN